MGLAVDALFFIVAFATPVAVSIGMISKADDLSKSFTWHPILMSLAFSCFMVLGRWAYVTDSIGDKAQQRPVHRALMVLALLFAIGGYVAIFMAHIKTPTFFGYDFAKHSWKVAPRVIHDFLGYGVLLLTLTQASMGLQKLAKLQSGVKIFTFHGQLGKLILLLAAIQILVACYLWIWSTGYKVLVAVLAVGAALCGTLFPHMAQERQLLSSRA
ncbi:unnamed protein product [Durusdinium trenchii]